jgi:eukaryotic-like serine/threonine-protein kinase
MPRLRKDGHMNAGALTGCVFGRYYVQGFLGSGGMGVVYHARDFEAGRDVALKVLSPGALLRPMALEGFRRKALWLSRCPDRHIAAVYDAGQVDGVDYVAMELMVTTLSRRLRERPFPEHELVDVGSQILLGLSAAHRRGVIHRDVKPGNVGISADETAKLLDFGVAAELGPSADPAETRTGEGGLPFAGTIHYMAPEQLRGEPIDERADLYSAGAVLYEMATGQRPFRCPQLACLIDAILNRVPVSPRRLNPSLSPAMQRVILQALDKEPDGRFATAAAMRKSLLRAGASRSQSLGSSSLFESAGEGMRWAC